MKFRNLIIDIIYTLYVVFLYYFTKDKNIFLYTLSLSLYYILSSMFLHIDTYPNLKKYYDDKHIYSLNTIYKYTNISIITINIIISIVVFLFSLLFNDLFNIKGLILVNTIMSTTLFIKPILNNIINFVRVYKFKTLAGNVLNIYKIFNFILMAICSLICFKLTNIEVHISISLLYICSIISFFLVYGLCHLLVLSNKIKKKQFKKQEERINYKKEIIDILSRNINISIIGIIKNAYMYISIIILYFVFKNRYGYSYIKLSSIINNLYLYAISIIYIIMLVIDYFEKDNIEKIKENIQNKKYELVNLDNYLIKMFNILLTIMIILNILSSSLWTLIFGSDDGHILYIISNITLFYIMYNIIVHISLNIMTNKKMYIVLLIGIFTKLATIVPLINSLYRMGYNLLYGDILSTMISYILVMSLLLIMNNKKYKIDFIKKFDTILNIIYYNIILCFTLLLFTIVIPIKVNNRIEAIKVIIVYLFISLLYIFIGKKLISNERIIKKNKE